MSTVQSTFELPDAIADALDPSGVNVSRRALEALLVHLGEISWVGQPRCFAHHGGSIADLSSGAFVHDYSGVLGLETGFCGRWMEELDVVGGLHRLRCPGTKSAALELWAGGSSRWSACSMQDAG